MKDQELLEIIGGLAGVQRKESFYRAAELAIDNNCKNIVATGCYRGIRGDGQSDKILSILAKRLGASYDCVDINPTHVGLAQEEVASVGVAKFYTMCSVQYLKQREQNIDFLYLDSYDFSEDNPWPAQFHQLDEIEAAAPRLTRRAIVLLDDVGIAHQGKGRLASLFLLSRGFKVEYEGYQRLFAKRL